MRHARLPRALSPRHTSRPGGGLCPLYRLQSAQKAAVAEPGDADQTSHGRGKDVFGYKDKTFAILDERLFTYWPLVGPFAPANRNDHLQTIPGLENLRRRFPDLKIGEVTADAGEGYDEMLAYFYDELHAVPLGDQRASSSDEDPLTCLKRGRCARRTAVPPRLSLGLQRSRFHPPRLQVGLPPMLPPPTPTRRHATCPSFPGPAGPARRTPSPGSGCAQLSLP